MKKFVISGSITWFVMMIVQIVISLCKPEWLVEDSAFYGLVYALIAWLPALSFAIIVDES